MSTLVLTRRIAAPLSVVWPMLVEENELRHWLGPRGFVVTELRADVRVGGTFRFRMRKQGGGDYGADGIYREIVEHERVVLMWRWNEAPAGEPLDRRETLLTLAVSAARGSDHTVLSLTHAQLPDEESVQSHRGGWNDALDKLQRDLETREQEKTR